MNLCLHLSRARFKGRGLNLFYFVSTCDTLNVKKNQWKFQKCIIELRLVFRKILTQILD